MLKGSPKGTLEMNIQSKIVRKLEEDELDDYEGNVEGSYNLVIELQIEVQNRILIETVEIGLWIWKRFCWINEWNILQKRSEA